MKILFIVFNFFITLSVYAADCARPAGSLPDPMRGAGIADPRNPIEHIIVIMQENHSFDQYFGKLNQDKFYGKEVDGVDPSQFFNLDKDGKKIYQYAEPNLCLKDVPHSWDAMWKAWNGGKNDLFVKGAKNTPRVMSYYDEKALPFYYAIANEFAIADRYFCSLLGPTFPNRFFLLTASAFGHIKNDFPKNNQEFTQPTIFDVLNKYGISWGYYSDSKIDGYLSLFRPFFHKNRDKIKKLAEWKKAIVAGTLPQVVFLDSAYEEKEDEHPDANIQVGQKWVYEQYHALVNSPYWKKSALFFTYDENGGFYDHVDPPKACVPDNIKPMLGPKNVKAEYDRLGFRVPFVLVSPYAKRHYVSHVTYDHASVLKFIEFKFNLPALTLRDANADAMMDLFDFEKPNFNVPNISEPRIQTSCNLR